jgi:hypothetical protein
MHADHAAERLGVPEPVRKKTVSLALRLLRFSLFRAKSRSPAQAVAAAVMTSMELVTSARVCETTARACGFKTTFGPIRDAWIDLRACIDEDVADMGFSHPRGEAHPLVTVETVLLMHEALT